MLFNEIISCLSDYCFFYAKKKRRFDQFAVFSSTHFSYKASLKLTQNSCSLVELLSVSHFQLKTAPFSHRRAIQEEIIVKCCFSARMTSCLIYGITMRMTQIFMLLRKRRMKKRNILKTQDFHLERKRNEIFQKLSKHPWLNINYFTICNREFCWSWGICAMCYTKQSSTYFRLFKRKIIREIKESFILMRENEFSCFLL